MKMRVRVLHTSGLMRRECATLTEAIDAAAHGDRIEADPGVYVEDVYIDKRVSLVGNNAGLRGNSTSRSAETHLVGRLVIGVGANDVLVDGVHVQGSVCSESIARFIDSLILRNCVIDSGGADTAISLDDGSGTTIANNFVRGSGDVLRVRAGVDVLSIVGNRFESVRRAAGLAINAGRELDRIVVSNNQFVGGDYGMRILVDRSLENARALMVVSGNTFGESVRGIVERAPKVAAVYAPVPIPSVLEPTLGSSLVFNTYHVSGDSIGIDVRFGSRAHHSIPDFQPERSHA